MLEHLMDLRPDGLILTRDVVEAGYWPALRSAVARGEYVRLRPGVYAAAARVNGSGAAARHRLALLAARAALGEQLVFADLSAAVLWRIPLVGVHLARVHVASAPAAGGRSRGGLVRHPARDLQQTQLDGLNVTTVAETVVDIARRYPFATGLVAADHALRRELTTIAELTRRQEAAVGRSGFRRSERVLLYADARAASPLESVSRAHMIDLRLAPDDLQRTIPARGGRHYEVDFWWEAENVVGESDGKSKYIDEEFANGRSPGEIVWEEKRREDAIRSRGHRVVRWGWAEAIRPPVLRAVLLEAGVREGRAGSVGSRLS